MKVVRLSALRTDHLYPPWNIPGTHFCKRLTRPLGHSAARRIVSMINSNDIIGNRTCDLRAVAQYLNHLRKRHGGEVPQHAPCDPEGSRRFGLLDFHDIRHMKIVRLSASRTGHLYPNEMFLVLIFTRGWVDPRAMVRLKVNMSLKNSVKIPGIDPGTVPLIA